MPVRHKTPLDIFKSTINLSKMTPLKRRNSTSEVNKPMPEEIIPGQNGLNGYLVKAKKRVNNKPKSERNLPQKAPSLPPENDEKKISDEKEQKNKAKFMKHRMPRLLYKCELCDYTNAKKYQIFRHSKCHTDCRPLKCFVCGRGFKTTSALSNHDRMHSGDKPYKCKQCDGCYSTSGELLRHIRYKHTHEKPHKCNECDYASVEASKLRRHMTCHNGVRPHQCPHCTYASSDMFKLKRHLRTHSGEKPYTCEICNTNFTQSNSLKSHLHIIHKKIQKPEYSCHICPAKVSRKPDLRTHIQRMHENIGLMKCKRCSLAFTDKYSLRVHCNTHKGEKAFKCSSCPYSSNIKRILNTHMLTHTGEKPFQCECGQSFRQEQLLHRHNNLYHNPDYVLPTPMKKCYQCVECGSSFARKGNLIRHIQMHETEKQKEQIMKSGTIEKTPLVSNATKEMDKDSDDEPLFEYKKALSECVTDISIISEEPVNSL